MKAPETPPKQPQHGPNGALPGNRLAVGSGWKSAIRKGLGASLGGQADAVAREAATLYRAFVAELAVDCASTRALAAQKARALAIANAYAQAAMVAGLTSEDGIKFGGEASKWDARAERLGVTGIATDRELSKQQHATSLPASPWIDTSSEAAE